MDGPVAPDRTGREGGGGGRLLDIRSPHQSMRRQFAANSAAILRRMTNLPICDLGKSQSPAKELSAMANQSRSSIILPKCRIPLDLWVFWVVSAILMASLNVVSAADQHSMTAREVTLELMRDRGSSKAVFAEKSLAGLDLSALPFDGADLSKTNLHGANLTNSTFIGANLRNSNLDRSTLIGADFTRADLTNSTILRPNVFVDLRRAIGSHPLIFDRAIMQSVNMNGRFDRVSFKGADLRNSIFGPRDPREEVLITPMMRLDGADFTAADLRGARLSRNSLESAVFRNADLRHADFRDARLGGADFRGARLDGALFSGATLTGAIFDQSTEVRARLGIHGR